MSLLDLIAIIEKLPPDKLAEVESLVDSLISKESPEEIPKKRQFGAFKGMITMSDDFDEPLEDFKEYMYP